MIGPLFPITSLDERVSALEGADYEFIFWREVSTTTGTITKPLGSTILLDRWPADVDAVVSIVTTGEVPDEEHAYTAAGEIVTTTLDTDGDFVLSDTPGDAIVAIIGRASCPAAAWKAMIDSGEVLLGFKKMDERDLGDYREKLKAATTTANTTFDLSLGTVQRWILDAARQFTMPADPGAFGKSFVLILEPATHAVTWEVASPLLEWLTNDGAAPTLVTDANLVNVLTFIWDDIDSRWLGFLGGSETA